MKKHDITTGQSLVAMAMALLLSIFYMGSAAQAADSTSTYIRNATLIDGTGADARKGINILLEGNRIAAIGRDVKAPKNARIIDATGKYVMPGIIDSHAHLNFPVLFQLSPEEKEAYINYIPKAFLYNGVTTILNVGSPFDWIMPRREAQREGRFMAPRIYALGAPFIPEKGWGSRHGDALATAKEARRRAEDYAAKGVDGIKLMIEDGLGSQGTHVEIPEDMLQAIAEVAKEKNLSVYTHAINLHEFHRAADVPSRAIIHGLEDPIPEGDNIIEKILAKNIYVVPTVSLFEAFLAPDPRAGIELRDPVLEASVPDFIVRNMRRKEFMDEEKRLFATASNMDPYAWARKHIPIFRENVRRMHEAGVKLAVGTDAGGTVGYNFQGYNTPWEVKILVECGLTPMEAIVAATRNGAELIGVADQLGTVETGKLADLLILSGDPLTNIENIREIEWVIQNGVAYRRDTFAYGK